MWGGIIVLGITEQELFDNSLKSKIKFVKHLAKNCNAREFEYLNKFIHSNITNSIHSNDGHTHTSNESSRDYQNKRIEKLLSLLVFAPEPMLENIISKLEDIEKISLQDIC